MLKSLGVKFMAGKYSANNPLSDIIPLEGTFVSTFLCDMPPITAKIYIYLLYLCNHQEIIVNSLCSVCTQYKLVSDIV